MPIADLLELYTEAAATQGETFITGDYKTGNKAADRIAFVYRELRRRGPEAQRALLGLLFHDNISVRSWAAAHALEFAPDHGAPVLRRIVDAGGIEGFNAEMTLMEWKAGNLRFP